jgi:hypothetical protein
MRCVGSFLVNRTTSSDQRVITRPRNVTATETAGGNLNQRFRR